MNNHCSASDFSKEYLATDWNPLVSMDQKNELIGPSNIFPAYNFELYCSSNLAVSDSQNGGKKFDEGDATQGMSDEREVRPETERDLGEKEETKQTESNQQSKEDYVHVRAKRGQATNSHSLAERVRRKKISERMRLLQDLVPGCSKITAKAVMLDEIINYVQSLQRQVEFLSMKLATVNPDLTVDLEQILSKELFPSQDRYRMFLGSDQGTSHIVSQLNRSGPHGLVQSEMWCTTPNPIQALHATIPHISTLSQVPGVWSNELQNAIQAGLISNTTHSIDESGSMKVE